MTQSVTSPRKPRKATRRPTHLLYGGTAYPITSEPFVLGVAVPADGRGMNLTGATAGISRSHCSVLRREDRVVIRDHSSHGSFLNGQRVEGEAELDAGDRLRLGSPGIELQLIEVIESGGTT